MVPIASLLVEVDARTGFTGHLTHASGKATRARELKRHLFYVLLAEAADKGATSARTWPPSPAIAAACAATSTAAR